MIFDVWRRDLAGQVTVAELRSNIHWMEEELAQAVPPKEDVPNTRFAAGQSVLQWWASWFKKEGPAPSRYSKKQRPTWFSGEILSPGVYMVDLMYASMPHTGWALRISSSAQLGSPEASVLASDTRSFTFKIWSPARTQHSLEFESRNCLFQMRTKKASVSTW